MKRRNKEKLIKITFWVALIVAILSCLCICTDGCEIQASIVCLIASGYCGLVAYANRGYWIFK